MTYLLNEQGSLNESTQNSKILIVDDAALNRELIVNYLENAGYTKLITAQNGFEAIEKVKTFRPELLILDLIMPKMDGFGVIRHLRAHSEFSSIPIIVQTAISAPEQRLEAWQSGANDVITKPIHRLELLSRINVQLKNMRLITTLQNYQGLAQSEIKQGLSLQHSILPSKALILSLEKKYTIDIASLFIPSRFLSGDLWGLIEISPTQLGVWIIDFTGKGVQAALNTFRLHTIINEYRYCADEPAEMIQTLNNRLQSVLPAGQFATCLVGVIDFEKDMFFYASASSPHPFIYHPGAKNFDLGNGTGMPLGIEYDQLYALRSLKFPKGSSLILYSDLLWEKNGIPGISFNNKNLRSFIHELDGQPLFPVIKDQVDLLGPSVVFPDDLTLIEMKRPHSRQ